MLSKILNKLSLIRQSYFKKINNNFYSQFGEDRILNEIIPKKKIGFYVDVGCFHHKKHSNTYLLHKRGWSGVNIDMESDKVKLFNICRPNDFNVVAAISNDVRNVKVYRNQKYGVSSTIVDGFINSDDIIDQNVIKTKTLDSVLELSPFKNKKIDLLNIDAEGNDFKVLISLNFKIYQPEIIIIETHLNNIEEILKSEIYSFLFNKKYSLISWNLYSLIFKKN